jgi:hypothetical protein
VAGFTVTETTNKVWKEKYIERQRKRYIQSVIIMVVVVVVIY